MDTKRLMMIAGAVAVLVIVAFLFLRPGDAPMEAPAPAVVPEKTPTPKGCVPCACPGADICKFTIEPVNSAGSFIGAAWLKAMFKITISTNESH